MDFHKKENAINLPTDEFMNDVDPLSDDSFTQNLLSDLLIPEKRPMAESFLSDFFKESEYDYSKITDYLFNFFNPNSEFGVDGVKTASHILHSIIFYISKHSIKKEKYEMLMSYRFYDLIWNFLTQSEFIILIFKRILKSQEKLENKYDNGSMCYYLEQKNIFEIVHQLLQEDHPLDISIALISLTKAFKEYPKAFPTLINLVPIICDIAFSSPEVQLYKVALKCLGMLSKSCAEIAFVIFNHPEFTNKCENYIEFSIYNDYFLEFLELALNNSEQFITENGQVLCKGSKLNKMILPIKPLIIKYLFHAISLFNKRQDKVSSLALRVLSLLMFDNQTVALCIENNISQLIFSILNDNTLFSYKVDAMKALCSMISLSEDKNIEYFINQGFATILEEYIDEFMTEIPHDIINALEVIVKCSEIHPEYSELSSFIFSSNQIFEALQKASEGEYGDKPSSLTDVSLVMHSRSLLERMEY